ncbi:MAG: QueT transporter family protein [Lachnospiraceae bacterium]|nr:QueT transporter family protein [Lachnospiraceae bacterium]
MSKKKNRKAKSAALKKEYAAEKNAVMKKEAAAAKEAAGSETVKAKDTAAKYNAVKANETVRIQESAAEKEAAAQNEMAAEAESKEKGGSVIKSKAASDPAKDNKELSFGKVKQFILVFLIFIVLGACFKVMVLVEGLTEVRPVNAVPVVSGLCFGTVAGWACAFGNLAADMFGTLEPSSVLGFAGNFLAAYMPYKLWYLYKEEAPNVHSFKNLMLYFRVSFISALAVAWMIGSGLWLVFRVWVPKIGLYIFLNDMVFPVLFGLPVFIILTSDSIRLRCAGRPKDILKISPEARKALTHVYTVLLMFVVVMTYFGADSMLLPSILLSIPLLILTVVLML